ncbi:MAG: hypothetical protein E6Q83_19045 [Thiothrix sp.]|nr:MAG: hypothetical protein E6Q83_19045 [Thiothrix sp.]
MKKFEVDYSITSPFKGIRIWFDHLEEGLDYAQENNIKEVLVRADEDDKKTVNFDFLKNRDFIETFHWIVSLSKKSDISGLAYLSKLKDLRWAADNHYDLDLSYFPLLRELTLGYDPNIKGWETLKSLKTLLIGSVKTEDLSFLKEVVSLEYLRIIRGSFVSIKGIENCNKLHTLFLQICRSLTDLNSTLKKLPALKQLNLEGCKKVNLDKELADLNIKNISII